MRKVIILLILFSFNLIITEDIFDQKNNINFINKEIKEENKKDMVCQPILKKMKPIYFGRWSPEIENKKDLEENIKAAIDALNSYPTFKILILGQTCLYYKSFFTSQMMLSAQRATKIRNEFVKNGVPEDRIIVTAIESQMATVPSEKGSSAQAKDRRVDIYYAVQF